MSTLVPDYLSLDFNTALAKLKEELKNSTIFKDYNYEGSNISILLELMAYFSDLNTFFINKAAKNIYLETTDIYECANRLTRQLGYEPKGKRSARATAQFTVTGHEIGSTLRVYPWKQLNSGRITDDSESILYATTEVTEAVTTSNPFTFNVPIRQGEIVNLTGFTGSDLIDNELILPSDYAYDDDVTDDAPSIQVSVNNSIWTRVSDFYDEIDLVTDVNNVYMFVYDRYERSKIVFNSSRSVPGKDDVISIIALKSLGVDGSIGADDEEEWTLIDDEIVDFSYDSSTPDYVNNSSITVAVSSASIGADDPETVDDIRMNAQSELHSQFRNVTAVDYKSHLEQRSDITVAKAWGEQDIAPSAGSILEYNRVYISIIPETWSSSTINTSASTFTTDWSTSASIMVPLSYNTTWESVIKNYLSSRKMITTYETLDLPDIIYFSFEIGVRIKRLYTFSNVKDDILNKLTYYFRQENQIFNGIINFNDIIEYIMDTSNISPDDDYTNINGIRNLNLRDINVSKTVYESNILGNYPYWIDSPYTNRDNTLRKIQLGNNQFPYLSRTSVTISEET